MGIAAYEDIANLALRELGSRAITDIDSTTDSVSLQVSDVFEPTRKALLRKHTWNFATTDAVLGHVVDSDIVITGATAANPVVITAVGHGLSDDNEVAIKNIVGMTELNGRKFTVANKTTDTFELSGEDGGEHTAYASAGTVGVITTFISATGYTNAYNLPSDYIRIITLNGNPEKNIKHRIKMLSDTKVLFVDDDSAELEYIYDQDDPTKYDDTFVDILALMLAAKLAFVITNSRSMAVSMKEAAEEALAEARGLNAFERGTPEEVQQDDIIDARE